jgi:8-oxo-dGTP pyrophosphatase MutT (NUDIX family)
MNITRSTARVLPVNHEGRVLLLLGQGLLRRGRPFWMSVGGGLERGETLPQAAARELHEEAGITVDPGDLGGDLGATVISYRAFTLLQVTQHQTYYALAVDDPAVSFAHQGFIERRCIDRHQWLSADELERRPERASDPDLPRLMRTAVSAVRPERGGRRERIR